MATRGGKRIGVVTVVTAALCLPVAAPAHDAALRTGPAAKVPHAGAADDPAVGGRFGVPFAEPTIDGRRTDEKCLRHPPDDSARTMNCKPAGASVNVLADGDALYWDALEGTENVRLNIVAEYGIAAINDQSRVLDLSGSPSWSVPSPSDGGANPDGYENTPILPPPLSTTEPENDGALFCSDNNLLADGRVLATGGTAYYNEPGAIVAGQPLGVSELEGLRNTRVYDPETNTWSQAGEMHHGRWYPTLVTLPGGDQFVASGVTKLLKPVYPGAPADSGTNVRQTETFDLDSGNWSENGDSAMRSLPLFPRLHLLPNGHIFYNAAGQSFNPFGQAYDEALWNIAATYDPGSKRWSDLGVPGLDAAPDPAKGIGNPAGDLQNAGIPGGGKAFTIPGFRGSTFSIMLPLRPGDDGSYDRAEFLTAGGVLNPPSPGSYFTTSDSRITTVEVSGGSAAMSTRATEDLGRPRWYPTGVALPTGEVIAFSGADRDEVAMPGVEFPVKRAEIFDPGTEEWSPLAEAHQPRTYHNSAVLLPSGKVLVGGHAPISTAYTKNQTLVPGLTAPNNGRDPSFEIYRPPYLFRGERPRIEGAERELSHGESTSVRVDGPAREIESLVLVRNPSLTHLVDGDQRTVELPVGARHGSRLEVTIPGANVLPPGPYMLFANRSGPDGAVPSRAVQSFVGID